MVKRNFQWITLMELAILPFTIVGLMFVCFAYLSIYLFHDQMRDPFLMPGIALLALAFGLWLLIGREPLVIKVRMAPLFAVTAWLITGICSAIPIIEITGVSLTQAMFESFSALTTTGATVLSSLDAMPETFLLYRQFLQWLGGLGIVIFVVAVLPNLNVGGMRLLKAEVPGPAKDDKLTSRTAKTAHYLWAIYLVITAGCALAYFLAGMSVFDAVAHSLSTVSTGGFSTHDDSLGYFHSELIYLISDVFMLAGAINFSLHFQYFRAKKSNVYLSNEETRTFLMIIGFLTLLMFATVLPTVDDANWFLTLNHSLFILISFITSTGFGAADFTEWPLAALFLLVIAGYLGGCAGSTAGGSKIVRIIILFKLVRREIQRLVHPNGIFSLRYQGRAIASAQVRNTLAFIFFVIASTALLTLLLMMMTGLDLWSSLSAVASCLNVLGPAFGELSSNFQPVNGVGLSLLTLSMILGRLEYLTLIVLLFPKYWRY